jgi:HD-GYP domain-containing protein (c-di-GMP phosphodiesterase class II)
VADAYDAMVTDRSFQAALKPLEALAELQRCAGTQFDPEVVVAMERVTAPHSLKRGRTVVDTFIQAERAGATIAENWRASA